ncbi:Retrotransposon gag protein [Cinnamomum micranthum f. kanehirae]|uniref:Retrotransposon gag protein n=1 Tax=Cinnamomum micranthum f. kanehirae TaxID=337451 RepID=A0A443Q5K2_9MAGN|nr:Retrotransposon gag protein [Cinnamomum micranthum f. kanehirae]
MASGSDSNPNNGGHATNPNGDHNGGEVNQPPRKLCDLLNPARRTTPSCIVLPAIAGQYEIKPGNIQLLPKFHRLDSESACLHLREFDEVCAILQLQNVVPNVI